jgi:hemerythrin-like domain-containing protein
MLERRTFIHDAAVVAVAIPVLGGLARADADPPANPPPKPSDVNATEDLMREHGVLRRVLLVYAEGARRIHAGTAPPAEVIRSAAGLFQKFVEGYHEKLEEEEVFPRLVASHKLKDLVTILKAQHEAGRKLTADILEHATPAAIGKRSLSKELAALLAQAIRMYEPHAAREDTVLFPAFHALFTEQEFDGLGEKFEEKEKAALGASGFEGAVTQVAQLEKALEIYDLSQFTPGASTL